MIRPGLVRFSLACLVILYHLTLSAFFGKFAVGCFFVLSGFWISAMVDKKYSKKKRYLYVFYISRLWRLLPSFYAFTLIGLILLLSLNTTFIKDFTTLSSIEKVRDVISNLILLGYANTKVNILAPAWSLDVELQFYILFPLVTFVTRNNKILLTAITTIFFCVSGYYLFHSKSYLANTSLPYIYLFLIGVIIYRYEIRPRRWLTLASSLVLLAIVLSQYQIPGLAILYRDMHSYYYQTLSFTLTMLAIPILITSIHTESNDFDRFLGNMSFMIYLSHWTWLIPYNDIIQSGGSAKKTVAILGFCTINAIISYAVYITVDRPSEVLRQKWLKRQP